tara:strand:- start:6326 stop:7114 length:789 start_codon:yes stop_codon:yes gene_type:complete
MQKTIFTMALILSAFGISNLTAQNTDDFVKFNPNLWVAKYEVSNEDYKEFLGDWLKKHGREETQKLKPDSAQWRTKLAKSHNEPMFEKYHNHPAYNNYPVVNISEDAAESYCKWLTEKYNSSKKREFKKVIFRLPTEKEWQSFSSPLIGNRLPWYGNFPYLSNENGQMDCMLTNIKMIDYTSGKFHHAADGGFYTTKIGVYKSNNLGLFDIIGNAAEMTGDAKIKGGSWDNTLEECYIDLSQNYSAPDPRVGFRLVMEVIEA